uniref:PH domain-containing protein n=2 Tax=Schizaphis graminum TaxID=13262 RepID=A0A2S2PGZ6_SCHGA
MEGRLLYTQPSDHNWRRGGRTIKLMPINAIIVTLGKPNDNYNPDADDIVFPRQNGIRDASLVLLKEKSGRISLLREPMYLDRCVLCCESDWDDYFELHEITTKDTYILKGQDGEQTKMWYKQLQYHCQTLGCWRKRRNALANIMINRNCT